MNEDEKLNKIEEEDEEEEFSLSEDIVLSTGRQHTSSESSKTGEKKKKKFKPGKFISKHLKIKRDEKKLDSGGENSETRSEDSSTKSPKLGILKRNIAKRFSRKKKYQISPLEGGDGAQHNEPLNNERDLKEIEKLSKSISNVGNNLSEGVINEDSAGLTKSMQPESPLNTTERKSSFTENKKVQLQITISGKKIEKVQTNSANEIVSTETIVSSTEIDKASSPSRLYDEKSQSDIILPSVSTAIQVNKIREEFFNGMMSRNNNNNDNAKIQYMQHHTKSISSDAIAQSVSRSTIKQTVNSEGYKVGNDKVVSKSEKEIEKYSLITSSLNSIISSAKELENIDALDDNKIEFPKNLPELKIVEESDVDGIKEDIKIQEIVLKVEEKVESNEQEEAAASDDEMRKSKIPVNVQRASSESATSEKDFSTVRTQEAHKPYHVNLSSSASIDELKIESEEIKFEVGTAVRPPKILSALNNNRNTTEIIITEIENESSSVQDDVFHSPKNDSNVAVQKRDSKTRRKIAYIPQLTIYTPEEQELLKSNIIANSESFDTPSLPLDSSMFPIFDDSMVRLLPHAYFISLEIHAIERLLN